MAKLEVIYSVAACLGGVLPKAMIVIFGWVGVLYLSIGDGPFMDESGY